jgi:hypothetical protein
MRLPDLVFFSLPNYELNKPFFFTKYPALGILL